MAIDETKAARIDAALDWLGDRDCVPSDVALDLRGLPYINRATEPEEDEQREYLPRMFADLFEDHE